MSGIVPKKKEFLDIKSQRTELRYKGFNQCIEQVLKNIDELDIVDILMNNLQVVGCNPSTCHAGIVGWDRCAKAIKEELKKESE